MLSTLKLVHTRVPETYPSSQCFRCNLQIEDFEHLWLCSKNEPNFNDLITLHKITFITHLTELNTLNNNFLVDEISTDDIWNSFPIANTFWFLDLIKGIVPKSLSEKVSACLSSKSLSHGLLSSLYQDISTSCHEIWIKRNADLNEWKIANNIEDDYTIPWASSGFPHSSPIPSISNPNSFLAACAYGSHWSNF